jgi:WD40 repeat protein
MRTIWAAAFSPDGRYLLTGGAAGESRFERGKTGGDNMVTEDDDTRNEIKIWDTTTWKPIKEFWGENRYTMAVAYSSDGRSVASCGTDGIVKVWDTVSFKERLRADVSCRIMGVAFSPDSKSVLVAVNNGLRIWDLGSGKEAASRKIADEGESLSRLCFSPDGKLLAIGSWATGTVRLFEFPEWKERKAIKAHNDTVAALAFCPDGNTLFSGSLDGSTRAWSVTTGKLIHTFGHEHTDSVKSLCVIRDGKALLTVYSCGTTDHIGIWDVETGIDSGLSK